MPSYEGLYICTVLIQFLISWSVNKTFLNWINNWNLIGNEMEGRNSNATPDKKDLSKFVKMVFFVTL